MLYILETVLVQPTTGKKILLRQSRGRRNIFTIPYCIHWYHKYVSCLRDVSDVSLGISSTLSITGGTLYEPHDVVQGLWYCSKHHVPEPWDITFYFHTQCTGEIHCSGRDD